MIELKKVWMDGKLVSRQDAKIDILTHALHYGCAVFEGIRCYKTKNGSAIFRAKEHTKRLLDSAKIMQMSIPYSEKELIAGMKQTIKANGLKECYVRPLVFYGLGSMGLNPLKANIQTAIMVWPWGAYLGKEGLEKGVRCKISSFQRHHVNSMMTKAKLSGNYPNSILAKLEAVRLGFDEAIMLDTHGLVSECSGENIFYVRDGVLYTPLRTSVLEGITRDSVMAIAKDLGISIKEEVTTRDQLYVADEVFLCGTAAEITPVREIDFRVIGDPGPITKKIQQVFFKAIRGEIPRYQRWLGFV